MQASKIKAVLFDFDGVLTTDKTGSLTTTRHLSERTGIALSQVQSVFRKYNTDLTLGRTTHGQVWDSICGDLGRHLSIELLEEAFESTPMNERMLRLAGELRSSCLVGIVTDNKKDRIDCLKKLHNLSSVFDPIVVSAEVGASKDDPKIFLDVLGRLGVRPDECIFIDNSRENLVAPSALGIKTIYFDDARQDFVALLAALQAHGAIASDAWPSHLDRAPREAGSSLETRGQRLEFQMTPERVISLAWKPLGGDERLLSNASFSRDGPWLASRFEVSALAAGVIGAASLAAAELWAKRRNESTRAVRVDRRLADGAIISERLFRALGWNAPDLRDMLTGDYRAADGWIRLHMNYAHHRDAATRVLGCAPDRGKITEAAAKRPGEALESAIVDAGGCAAQLRTIEAWAAHPQGAAVAKEPLVAREGRCRPRLDREQADAPLAGIRIVDMTRVIAGPFGTRFLAAMGADVLRIDPPGFEEVGAILPEATRGKRRALVDLRSPEGRATWEALLRDADVLVHGYRGGAMEALGYGESRLRSINPDLVVVRHDAYGWTGPWRERRGFDSLVQMSSGIAHPGHDGKPTPLPAQALDHATGYLIAAATCRALTDGTASSRLSLARTARFLVDLGMNGDANAPGIGNADDVLEPSRTAWGESLQVRTPGEIEGYTPRWKHEPGPLGTHLPRW